MTVRRLSPEFWEWLDGLSKAVIIPMPLCSRCGENDPEYVSDESCSRCGKQQEDQLEHMRRNMNRMLY